MKKTHEQALETFQSALEIEEKENNELEGKLNAEKEKLAKAKSELEEAKEEATRTVTSTFLHLVGVSVNTDKGCGVVQSVNGATAEVKLEDFEEILSMNCMEIEDLIEKEKKLSLEEMIKLQKELSESKLQLELTKRQWKKSQVLAKRRVIAQRTAITKYKSDKDTLLKIVTALEKKLLDANNVLLEKRRKVIRKKRKFAIKGQTITQRQGDALHQFMAGL
jgi:hypothetical protein